MPYEIIDAHNHVISPDTATYPLAPVGGKQSDWSARRPASTEQLIAAMDEAGVARSVVVQASTAYGHDNSYLLSAVRAHPDRLTGVFSVDVLAPDATDQIRRWHDAGLAGFRLFTTGSTMPGQADWLDDERSFPAWALAQERRMPVCMQMTIAGIPRLRRVLDRFPGVPIVLDHLARPDLSDGPPYDLAAPLFELAEYPQVFLKLTIRAIEAAGQGNSTVPVFLHSIIERFGANRILWGSNFPAHAGGLPHLLSVAKEALAVLPEEEQAWIFSGTVRRVYPGLGGQHG